MSDRDYSVSIMGESPDGERFHVSLDFQHPGLLDIRLTALRNAALEIARGTFTNVGKDTPLTSHDDWGTE